MIFGTDLIRASAFLMTFVALMEKRAEKVKCYNCYINVMN